MYNKMSFGENLINLRRQKGWSQDDLANNLNISRQAISKWETDISKPDVDNLERISKIFSVTIDNLLDNDLPNDKAVALDVKKKEKKEKTITIVKLMIIAVIILYAISVIYKFASLLVIVNGVQKYANLNNYHYVITTYDENGLVEKEECWFKDGVSKTVNLMYSDENIEKNLVCINFNDKIGYIQRNNEDRVNIDINEYEMAHKEFSRGGQLYSKIPSFMTNHKISELILNSLSLKKISIKSYEKCFFMNYNNEFIVLDDYYLLPIYYMYEDKNNESFLTNTFYIDLNSVEDLKI